MGADRGEPISLAEHRGHRVVRQWWTRQGGARWQQVRLGELPDGRWYVQHSTASGHRQTRAYRTAPDAVRVARRVMAAEASGWDEVPTTAP